MDQADFPLAYRVPAPSVDPDGLTFSFGGERATQGNDQWLSISPAAAAKIDATWHDIMRAHQQPVFAYVLSELPTYEPSTLMLRARIHQLPPGRRPEVELEATDHPPAVEQRECISPERIAAIHRNVAAADAR